VKDLLITMPKDETLQEFNTQAITCDKLTTGSLRGAKKSNLTGETQITL
jgi:hypothetical protein